MHRPLHRYEVAPVKCVNVRMCLWELIPVFECNMPASEELQRIRANGKYTYSDTIWTIASSRQMLRNVTNEDCRKFKISLRHETLAISKPPVEMQELTAAELQRI